nr:MAG TPA: transposase [Caudoviricetes sp.]
MLQHYGKATAIDLSDLIEDRRTIEDQSECLAPVISYENYRAQARRGRIKVLRKGGGKGGSVLVDYDSLPLDLRDKVDQRLGGDAVHVATLRKWFSDHYRRDRGAMEYYPKRLRELNLSLPLERIAQLTEEYTVNASVLMAVKNLQADMRLLKRVMGGKKTIRWEQLASAIGYYRQEVGHTLPQSAARFRKAMREFDERGYESLISKKFGNQQTRKVDRDTLYLLLALDNDDMRPYNSTVAERYNRFVEGELTVYNPETGELYDPTPYKPLSETTVANYLSTPEAKALRGKVHDDYQTWRGKHQPYVMRKRPTMSLSKISLDDRDLKIKVNWREQGISETVSLKIYVAYDLASQAIIGYAFSGKKRHDIFIGCLRSTFRTLLSLGLPCPHEAEVEQHLVSDFRTSLMADGALFPKALFLAPGNSQAKGAEHFNRLFKYTIEKEYIPNTGRHYAKLEANQTSEEKSFDEHNDRFKVKAWAYEDAVAYYEELIYKYNHSPHSNEAYWGGRTRWEVLQESVNPELASIDEHRLAVLLGEHRATSVRRGSIKANYRSFALSPEAIGKLKDRNGKVDAYWWEQEEGQMDAVYIYEGGRYIETATEVERFNEATIEQTAEDRKKLHGQLQRVKSFDTYITERLPAKARLLKEETHRMLTDLEPQEVVTLRRGEDGELHDENEEEDWLVTSPEVDDIRARALADL